MAETVKLTIDGREVEVPRGTGLVEAAAATGIEVPVFCYEARLGPAVGACRMCLVEIEGMPKLQTACSTMASEGMNVTTISGRAREAQEAVLEFLLINHPLDCPVCDKGGECPLQDHTYRWGPGESRFRETKRNNDKPIPVSPLIALDRERCILCYRCTRFSSDVAQDNQLIARDRGANSVISTFEGRPYAGHFSGNIIELCPVGALTSTEYRFHGRPWDTVDLPTVCGMCAVGCNTHATVREGIVQRVLSRAHDEVDNGWLCDRGRFSYTSNHAEGRVRVPEAGSSGAGGRRAVSWEVALETLHGRLTESSVDWILSGSETLEEAYTIQAIAAKLGGRVFAAPGRVSAAPVAPAGQATLADIAGAAHIVVVGDEELSEIAPVAELHVRAAMTQHRASVTVVGAGGTALEPAGAELCQANPQQLPAMLEALAAGSGAAADLHARLQAATNVVVIAPDGLVEPSLLEALVAPLGLDADGSGIIGAPRASNARGLAAIGIAEMPAIGDLARDLVLVNIDGERHLGTGWTQLVDHAQSVACVAEFHGPATGAADLILPAASPFETEGTIVNMTGRLQRLAPTVPSPGHRTELQWLTGIMRRAGGGLQANPGSVYRTLAADSALPGTFPAATYAEIPSGGIDGVVGGAPAKAAAGATLEDGQVVQIARGIYDAADVDHATAMDFLRDEAWVTLARLDADGLGVQRGDEISIDLGDVAITAKVAVSRRLASGVVRLRAGMPGVPAGREGYHPAKISVRSAGTA